MQLLGIRKYIELSSILAMTAVIIVLDVIVTASLALASDFHATCEKEFAKLESLERRCKSEAVRLDRRFWTGNINTQETLYFFLSDTSIDENLSAGCTLAADKSILFIGLYYSKSIDGGNLAMHFRKVISVDFRGNARVQTEKGDAIMLALMPFKLRTPRGGAEYSANVFEPCSRSNGHSAIGPRGTSQSRYMVEQLRDGVLISQCSSFDRPEHKTECTKTAFTCVTSKCNASLVYYTPSIVIDERGGVYVMSTVATRICQDQEPQVSFLGAFIKEHCAQQR